MIWSPNSPTPLLLTIAMSALLSSCVPFTSDIPDRADFFAALHDRELSSFEYGLAVERHTGNEDQWTEAANAFLELSTCLEITEASQLLTADPRAHLVHQLVVIEEHRRLRLIETFRESGTRGWHRGTIHTKFTSADYFNREPEPLDPALIRWPQESNTWQDEWPAPTEIPFDCANLGERKLIPLPSTLIDIKASMVSHRMLSEWHQTSTALSILDEITDPEDHEFAREARISLAVHRADLAIALMEREEVRSTAPEALDQLANEALDALLELVPLQDSTRPHLHPLGVALRITDLAIQLDDPDTALDTLTILRDHPNETVADTARYLHVKIAWTQGWWESAAEGAPNLLRRGSPLRSAHAYFAATAHRFSGSEDKFLGLARDALQDRPRGVNDPFLGALYREVLRELARYDVDERTDEILEELGPRSQLSERRRELAEVALDLGRPEVARSLVEPLLEDNSDARRLPKLHAILALAAFLSDDRSTFTTHIDALSRRPAGLQELIPRGRRASFFAHQDSELARVLRAMLPLMAEWGEEAPARALRQVWLGVIVDHTQTFLRWAPQSAVSETLTELYHLAGQLLEEHPRGYAQRVGAEEPSAAALVLGTVELTTAPPIEEAPQPRLRWPALDSLLLIPVGGLPPQHFVHDIGLLPSDEEATP